MSPSEFLACRPGFRTCSVFFEARKRPSPPHQSREGPSSELTCPYLCLGLRSRPRRLLFSLRAPTTLHRPPVAPSSRIPLRIFISHPPSVSCSCSLFSPPTAPLSRLPTRCYPLPAPPPLLPLPCSPSPFPGDLLANPFRDPCEGLHQAIEVLCVNDDGSNSSHYSSIVAPFY